MRNVVLFLKLALRRLSNPVFFMLLILSAVMWCVTKLSYVYTSDIVIPVKIDSTLYSVRCNVEGIGYQLLMHNIAPRKNTVRLSSDNVMITPSATSPTSYEITPFALQNAISNKLTNLKIRSVEAPVEVKLGTIEQ